MNADILWREFAPILVGILGGALVGSVVGPVVAGVFAIIGFVLGTEVGMLLYMHRLCRAHYALMTELTGVRMSNYVARATKKVAIICGVAGALVGAIGFGEAVFGAVVFAALGAIGGALAGPTWWYCVCAEIIDGTVGADTYEALAGESLPRL